MGLLLRVLGFVVFVAAVAGATYGAFHAYGVDVAYSSLALSPPEGEPPALLAGATEAVALQVENLGDAPLSVRVSSPTPGFTYETEPAVIALAPGERLTIDGTLAAPDDAIGAAAVELVAVDDATGRVLDALRLDVTVHELVLGDVRVATFVPGIVPGARFEAKVTVTNPSAAPQRYVLSAEGAPAAFDPPSLTVPPGGEGTSYATLTAPAGASETVEITFAASLGAGPAAFQIARIPVVPAGDAGAAALFGEFAVRPEQIFSVPVTIVSNLAQDVPVDVQVPGAVASTFTTARAGEVTAGFITLTAPPEIPEQGGVLELRLILGESSIRLPVTIVPASGTRAAPGTTISIDYVGRLLDGRVFDASVEEVSRGAFPKADTFRSRTSGFEPIVFPVDPARAGVIEGMLEGVTGMTLGETRTLLIPPEKAYGPARIHVNISRTSTVDRVTEASRDVDPRTPGPDALAIAELPPELAVVGNEVGDVVTWDRAVEGVQFHERFRILAIDDESVTLVRHAEVGDRTTLQLAWPDASEVIEVRDDAIVYRTTPPAGAASFPWRHVAVLARDAQGSPVELAGAEDVPTSVQSVDDTRIVLSHDPPVGFTYTHVLGQQQASVGVESVEIDTLRLVGPALSPLAGQALVFDVWVRNVET